MPVLSRRRRAVVLSAAAALALTTLAAPGSSAAAPGSSGAAPSRSLLGTEPTANGTLVTLITGDRAVLTTDPNGKPGATLLPRPGGDAHGYTTRAFRDDLYVIPAAAMPLIAAGRVDEELFNVTGLVRQGYDDRSTAILPVLATYGGSLRRTRQAPAAPDGATVAASLPVADAVALDVTKEKAAELWRDLTDGKGPAIGKLWLDGRVTAAMAETTAQINAPQAWKAGLDGAGTTVAVLDSGYDANHPDLAGQVVGEKNFTDETGGAVDRNGHGTHVASTVAGTGAASGGAEKGVAPGADLLIGKVLNREGRGQESWIIAGMQWAVDNGADVVNMSLGGSIGTDCTDPLGVTAQQLTRQSHTLFVISAGNSGSAARTLGSPACADGALTVAAVDAAGATAGFSSRGPVTGSHKVKPEIAAPGVDVLAAAMGSPGGNPYVRMSGTSMAAPHVAGVAALLSQRHPKWSAQQRKDVLVSSVQPGGQGSVYAQGAGVVDAYRAINATVYGPGTVDAGSYAWPHQHQQPTTTTVTLTNTGDSAVTFALSIEGATGEDGQPLAKRTLNVGVDQVTVPARGTADVPVVLDPSVRQSDAGYGTIGGRLVARAADGTTVTTAVGAWLEPHTVTVTLDLIDRRGQAPTAGSFVDVVDIDRLTAQRFSTFDTAPQLRLREGRYSIAALIASLDEGTTGEQGLVKSIAFMGDPDLVINNSATDMTITYDARTAVRQQVKGERPLEAQSTTLQYARWWDAAYLAASYSGGKSVDEVYVGQTAPVHSGKFELDTFYRMYAPELSLRSSTGTALAPEYMVGNFIQGTASVKLDGSGSAPLVAAGAGTRAEIEAAGVAGKVVLVHDAVNSATTLTAAAAAGAKAVLFGQDTPGRWLAVSTATIPGLTLSGAETAALRADLAAGPVTLSWDAVAASPYVYHLAFVAEGKTQPQVPLHVRDRDLGRVDEQINSLRTDRAVIDYLRAFRPDFPTVSTTLSEAFTAPIQRTVYYTANQQWQHMVGGAAVFDEVMFDIPRTYAAGSQRTERWYGGPVRSVATRRADGLAERISERQGNLIGVAMIPFGDTEPDHFSTGGGFGDTGAAILTRNGEQIEALAWPSGVFTVPDGDADYQLRVLTMRFNPRPPYHPNWNLFHRTDTTFRFRSERPADDALQALPIVVPTYDIALDSRNLAPADAAFAVRFDGVGQRDYDAGDIVDAKLWVSFDDGTTWTQAPVAASGPGFVGTVDQSAAAGRDVSLKVDLTDAHGNGVEQTIIRAYGVR
ncbi:S8 family serine peptidase [Micromonospora sp. NPDC049048]|uniref:S8 family serine peptidase n=1 Tax=Micromonospora sp. NPDC049048 TaxID=3364263 RepID=UPI00371DF8A3